MDTINSNNLAGGEILPAPELPALSGDRGKWAQEYEAFLAMLPELLQTHRDKFVAVHEGKVVDTGEDKVELALRVYKAFGYQPIYFGQVTVRPTVIRMPRFRRLDE